MSTQYATVVASGTQYRVKSGDTITVNRLAADVGSEVTLAPVLLIEKADGGIVAAQGEDGAVAGASVKATVIDHPRGDKLRVFKMRRRKKSRRTQGHRQDLTRLTIGDITLSA